MSGRIDKETQDVAMMICDQSGINSSWAFAIEGGGFVPAWAMYVSEAGKLMATARNLKKIKVSS